MKNNKRLYVLGGAILVAFVGFAFSSFTTALTPYVNYEQAVTADRVVQVAGGLVQGSSDWREEDENLWFTLEDPANKKQLRVRYSGVKPANFEDAISIVAIGRWDKESQALAADSPQVKGFLGDPFFEKLIRFGR